MKSISNFIFNAVIFSFPLACLIHCSTVSKFEKFEKKLDSVIQNKTEELRILDSKENKTEEDKAKIESGEAELLSLKSMKIEFSDLKSSYSDLQKENNDLRWKYYKVVFMSWLGRIGWLFVGLCILVIYGIRFYLQIHG